MTHPPHPEATALRVLPTHRLTMSLRETQMRPQLYTALIGARAWLEDAEIQLHNGRAMLERAAESSSDSEADRAVIDTLRTRVEAIAVQARRTLEAVESALRDGTE